MSRNTRSKFNPLSSLRCRLRPSQTSPATRAVDLHNGEAEYSAAQRLPQELLIITANLTIPIGYAAFAYADLHTPFVYDYVDIPSFRKATLDLLAFTRICKSWNRAGTEALYTRLYLTSQYRVWCFNRTLKNNPSLASLVRQIFVLQPISSSRLPTSRDMLRLQKDTCRAQSDFAASLRACKSLHTLTFTVYHSGHTRTFSSWDNEFIRGIDSQIPPSLKRLAIIGRTSKADPSPISLIPSSTFLPCLKHLKLSNVQLDPYHDFPELPSLRILEIEDLIHPYDPEFPFPLCIQSCKFPSLTALTFFQSSAKISIDEKCLAKLHELALFGVEELEYYQSEIQKGTLDRIKELTFSLDHYEDGQFVVERLPKNLERLFLYSNFTGNKSDHPERPPLGPLRDFLGLGGFVSALSSCDALKEIEFNMGTFEDQDTSGFDAALEEVRVLCRLGRVEFDLKRYRKEEYLRAAESQVVEWLDY